MFSKNYIKRIPADWFGKEFSSTLKHLALSGNGIQYIEDKAFSHLISLITLNLSRNKLGTINRTMLPAPGAQLMTLDLG